VLDRVYRAVAWQRVHQIRYNIENSPFLRHLDFMQMLRNSLLWNLDCHHCGHISSLLYLILSEKSSYAQTNNFENIYGREIILNFIPLLKCIRMFRFLKKKKSTFELIITGFAMKVDVAVCTMKDATFPSPIKMGECVYMLRRSHCSTRAYETKDFFPLRRFHGLKY
jgi:hypothetical protein